MKQLYNHLRVQFCLVTLFLFATFRSSAQQYPTVDGTITYVGDPTTSLISEYGSMDQNWTTSGGTRWHMTFDDTYLYIGVQTASSNVPAVLYLNFTTSPGISSGVEGSSVSLPFAADAAIILGSDAASSSVQVPTQQGGGLGWQNSTLPSPNTTELAFSATSREIKVAWKRMSPAGKPATFEWLAYLQNATNNPVPVANSTGMNYTYYYNVFTPSNAPTFQRLSYTAPDNATSAPAGTFFNYAVSSGDRTIPLSGDLTVNGLLYIRNTILKTNAYTVTLDQYATLDEEENNKTNSNANGYILGKVATTTNLEANGTYTFSNTGLKLQLENGTSSSTYPGRTLITRLTGETYVGGTGNTTISRFFFISPSNTSASSTLDITMTLHYAQSEINSLPEGQLSFFKSKLPPTITIAGTTFGEEGRDRTGLNAGNNTVRLSGVDLTGIWTLAAKGKPLPVELTQFTGQAEASAVRLRWATAVELNNKGFEVQHQLPNGKWRALGFVNGKGSSERASSYEYLDRTANAGLQYYRLAQTDLDGKITYSAVVTVKVSDPAGAQFVLYPSPASSSLSVSGLASGRHSVEIYNAQGQRVLTQELTEAQPTVSVTALPAGIYTMRVAGQGQAAKSSRFIKE